jgi:hypothetical protein
MAMPPRGTASEHGNRGTGSLTGATGPITAQSSKVIATAAIPINHHA